MSETEAGIVVPGLPPPRKPGDELAPQPWYRTRWGGPVLAIACVGIWVVLSQIAPAIVAVIAILVDHEGKMPPSEELQRALLPYLGWLVALGVPVAIGLVATLRALGWLAANPDGRARGRPLQIAGWTLALIGACLLGQQAIGLAMSSVGMEPQEQEVVLELLASPSVGIVLAFVILAPIAEELLLRRIVFGTLVVSNGRLLAYLVSGLIFAVLHMNPTVIAGYLWMSICFAFAYEITGSIWSAIVVHGVNNLIAVTAQLYST